jgi:hypothetical protein
MGKYMAYTPAKRLESKHQCRSSLDLRHDEEKSAPLQPRPSRYRTLKGGERSIGISTGTGAIERCTNGAPCMHWHELLFAAVSTPTHRRVLFGHKMQED